MGYEPTHMCKGNVICPMLHACALKCQSCNARVASHEYKRGRSNIPHTGDNDGLDNCELSLVFPFQGSCVSNVQIGGDSNANNGVGVIIGPRVKLHSLLMHMDADIKPYILTCIHCQVIRHLKVQCMHARMYGLIQRLCIKPYNMDTIHVMTLQIHQYNPPYIMYGGLY